jgi:hypothetical protein
MKSPSWSYCINYISEVFSNEVSVGLLIRSKWHGMEKEEAADLMQSHSFPVGLEKTSNYL